MKIRYLGHAAFELSLESGARIIFDPYTSGAFGGGFAYAPITGSYDVAVVSHDHDDHCCKGVLALAKKIINKSGSVLVDGASIKSVESFHDDAKGSKRGENLVTVVEAEGIRVAHLGDLGHAITAKQYPLLKGVDVLMIPVGGHFTIDAGVAAKIVKEFAPKITIPMHFKTPKVDFPIAPVENFTKLVDNVERTGVSEIVVTKATLPSRPKVVVLESAN
ncbi:MAG TPA: MBL fold metallo-hydrolase [Candidatus Bathyarchaeia archaeon]|nr:MBL fold metallo-hydrolase [Candidatus Bathyarchaeia archaeon]